jgi:hypothetical protein
MELFEGNIIDLLPAACPTRPRSIRAVAQSKPVAHVVVVSQKPFARVISLPKRVQRPGCRCGECPTCLEDARWERIFKEKFADPSYYQGRVPSYSSPLAQSRTH